MCIEYMYRHIRKLSPTELFTTRDMLIYGSRSAVDAALHRMVKSQFIIRLARGVFVRDDSEKPSLSEIVEAKAKAFGLTIVTHAENILHELKLWPCGSHNTFAKNGSSSSFWTVHGRVYLKGLCARKIRMCESKIGRIVNALWYLGRQGCTKFDVDFASMNLRRTERQEFWLAGSTMPAWLNKMCRHRYPQVRVMRN